MLKSRLPLVRSFSFFLSFSSVSRAYRKSNFDPHPEDRPLIVQFCGHDPALLLASAKFVEKDCDAIDLNLVRWEKMERYISPGSRKRARGGGGDPAAE